MSNDTLLERRNVLKALGGLGAAGVIGGAGLTAFTGSAYAVGQQNLNAGTVTSDDGTVEYVAMWGDSVVEWDGFDTPAQYFSLKITAELTGDRTYGPTGIYETGASSESDLGGDVGLVDLDESWGGSNEVLSGSGTSGSIESAVGLSGGSHEPTTDWHVVGTDPDGYGLPLRSIPADALTVTTDGGTNSYTVVIRSTYRWYDATETEIFSKTFESGIDVTVENEPMSSTATTGNETDGATAQ